jgi:hypothetical protein
MLQGAEVTVAAIWLDALVTWCLSLGPSAQYALPVAGATVGLLGAALSWGLVWQRAPWRAREIFRARRTRLHGIDAGARVSLVGRVRVSGKRTVPSFGRADRAVAVSSLAGRVGSASEPIATRAADGLAIETREGLVPIVGAIDVRRTRGGARARNLDADAQARALGATNLRATDLVEGQWVLAEGVVAHVAREGLREQGAVRGLRGASEPVALTALWPEVPRWTWAVATLGALALALLVTPLPWATPGLHRVSRDGASRRGAWEVLTAARLLGPTREATLRQIADSPLDPAQRRRFAVAQTELGNCGVAVVAFAALRQDEEALALLDAGECRVAPALRLQLFRESGFASRALGVSSELDLYERIRRALSDEAGGEQRYAEGPAEPPLDAPRADDLVCDPGCLEAIRGAGEGALEIVEARMPGRRTGCQSSLGAQDLLLELGLECGRFTPEEGATAVRRAPRPVTVLPLSHVEARLHVMRALLRAAGDEDGARVMEARQRRILATLATPQGARAEARWIEPARIDLEAIMRAHGPSGSGCDPLWGLTEERIREQMGTP